MTDLDGLIAAALSGPVDWPTDAAAGKVAERAIYHGVAGVLMQRKDHIGHWPQDVRSLLHAEALAQTMWEMRHRSVLTPVLEALHTAGIRCVLLKGTALAYGLYPSAPMRARGDTDLLVAPDALAHTHDILKSLGFRCDAAMSASDASLERQESWMFTASDSSHHEIDLHVDIFSSPALKPILNAAHAQDWAIAVPAFSDAARMLPMPLALLQACVHRAQHVLSPYSVAGQWHYGGDRLIWLVDIDLALRTMTPAQLIVFEKAAITAGVGPICGAALRASVKVLKTPCPDELIAALDGAPAGPASQYLTQDRSLGRVVQDLRAIPGVMGKLRHAVLRLFPSANALRGRYPDLAEATLARLYLRRITGLFRKRKADRT